MRKFYNKISKQQWRVTVPNINTSLLNKIPNKISEDIKSNSRNSGSYDLEQAQKEYDKSRSLPNSVYVNSDVSSDSDSDDENFEDARTSDRNSNVDTNRETSEDDFLDSELYADVLVVNKMEPEPTKTNDVNEQYQYDVPKISFSFFSKTSTFKSDSVDETQDENTYENRQAVVLKSEVKFNVSNPEEDEFKKGEEVLSVKSESIEILPVMGIIKCGSDPNLVMRDKGDNEDDGLYKIPRRLARCRLSQSLNDFNVEEFQAYTSDHSSIEHVSCSQVIVAKQGDVEPTSTNNAESLDYCKARSKLPVKLRRPTFLKKPKKAVNTWNNFRTKINNMMIEHAAQQRVGAYNDKEKVMINFEEVYKTSKNRCKNAFRSTTKIFKRSHDTSFDSENSSQITKTDVRTPITPKDIEYKFNFNNDKVTHDVSSSKIVEKHEHDDEKVDFDFSSIKSAFRRSKFVAEVRTSFIIETKKNC